MDLWIRSQDRKRLTKVEDIYMVEDKNNFTSYIGNNMVGHLGEYKKVGRALEVLDEIQDILRGKYAVSLNFKDAFSSNFTAEQAQKLLEQLAVYEMPEE